MSLWQKWLKKNNLIEWGPNFDTDAYNKDKSLLHSVTKILEKDGFKIEEPLSLSLPTYHVFVYPPPSANFTGKPIELRLIRINNQRLFGISVSDKQYDMKQINNLIADIKNYFAMKI